MTETNPSLRIAVVGVGAFGRNHVRVLKELPQAQLVGIFDANPATAAAISTEFGVHAFSSLEELASATDAAVVAVPTSAHESVACALLSSGVDVLVEKPIAPDVASGQRIVDCAAAHSRILQVGHLERFNPAVAALERALTLPLFFEIHRMNLFSPRSLDVDVVLDLMIHDIDLLLALTNSRPTDIKAAGIHILSSKVDIANVRMEFPGGVIANLTASRASTERVRKLRLFQPGSYLSLDFAKQELFQVLVGDNRQIRMQPHAIPKQEPLARELASFLDCVRLREKPKVDGVTSLQSLAVALDVIDKMELHAGVVAATLANAGYSAF